MKVIVKDCMMLSAEIVCTTLLIIIDLIVKHFIQQYIPLGDIHHLIPGILDITYVQNTGAAFSIFSNSYIFLLIIRLSIVCCITVFLLFSYRKIDLFIRYSLYLVLAGALGNVVDQIIFKYVRDMFSFAFIEFAVFNVADIYITVGCVLLLINFVFSKKYKKRLALFEMCDII